MNTKLIEELRWQAGVTIDESENISYAFTPQMLEEYTKLVVQECIKVCEDFDGVDNFEQHLNPRTIRYECAAEIRETFGVE